MFAVNAFLCAWTTMCPLEEKDGQMVINDATRIKETVPTLKLLIEKGAKIILAAHLGRPKGKREPSMSLRPVAAKARRFARAPRGVRG